MLGRAAQVFTNIGTNVGFALTAMATFSMALVHAKRQAAVTGTAVKGLSGTLRAFNKIFLTPALGVTVQMAGGLFVLGVALVGVMKYFSGAKTIGEGFHIILDLSLIHI